MLQRGVAMRYRVFMLVLALTVLLAATVTATTLGSPAKSSKASAEGTVVLSGWASSPEETALLKQVLRGFSKTFPKIKVDYQPISGDYVASMLAKFSARKPADVFYVDSNVILDWVTQGLLEPLNSYATASKFSNKPFYSTLLNGFTYKGKVYGYPKDWSPLAMEVNNSFAAKAGVKPTAITNWTTLTAAANKLKPVVTGGRPICLSPSWDRALAFVYQNGGSFLNAARTKSTINSPAAKAALNYYVGLITSGLAGTPAQLGVGWCGEALGKQKAAIAFEGNWAFPFMSTTFPDVKFTTVRMIAQKQHGNLAFTVSYSMAKDSSNKDAAWQLIRYLVSKPGMKTWTSKGLALPSRSDVAPVAGRKSFLADAPAAHPWQFAPKFSKVIDVANNELSAVIEGKESVAEMLTKVESASNDALKS
jgi:multiple sugar transport system substrate-binding protein